MTHANLFRRLAALDVVLPELRGEAEAAQRDKRMAALRAFVDAAWPDRRESVAHHVALILGLPHARALAECLKGEPLETVAEQHHGPDWREKAEGIANEAGLACWAAWGPDWADRFMAIWQGEG